MPFRCRFSDSGDGFFRCGPAGRIALRHHFWYLCCCETLNVAEVAGQARDPPHACDRLWIYSLSVGEVEVGEATEPTPVLQLCCRRTRHDHESRVPLPDQRSTAIAIVLTRGL